MGPNRIAKAFWDLEVVKNTLEAKGDILKAFQGFCHLHTLDLSFSGHLIYSVTECSQEKESLYQAVKVAGHTFVDQTLVLLFLWNLA